jgi:tetratricopeptide (TPR) repeat protein
MGFVLACENGAGIPGRYAKESALDAAGTLAASRRRLGSYKVGAIHEPECERGNMLTIIPTESLAILAALLLAIGGGPVFAQVPPSAARAAPDAPFRAAYVPERDDEALQQVPPASNPAVRRMSALRARLAGDPSNLRLATELARTYVDFGREVGDAHYAGYAEAVLAPWMARGEPPVNVMVIQATILQFRHEFSAARALLKQALKRDPKDAQAWLTLATLDMVQGDYTAAVSECAQVDRTGGLFLGTACSGSVHSYTGRARESVALFTALASQSSAANPALAAWTYGLLAESCERLGDWAGAEVHYRKALSYAPGDTFLLVAYADLLLDRNRPAEVIKLLADFALSDTAYLRLALAHAALKTPEASRYAWTMGARFDALAQRGSDYFGREQVRFALHLQRDPRSALILAQKNWEVQRAPWDARVLLEAARAARDPQAAVPVIAFVRETRLEDPVIERLVRELEPRAKIAAVAR